MKNKIVGVFLIGIIIYLLVLSISATKDFFALSSLTNFVCSLPLCYIASRIIVGVLTKYILTNKLN
jgi:hypothetical protein